jgi:hypothetical protein
MSRVRTWFFLLNYYAHDFFTGVWGACFLVLAILHGRYGGGGLAAGETALVAELYALFLGLQVAALALVAVTGAGRSFDPSLGYRGDAAREKRYFLLVKHAVLGTFFVGGTIAGFWWSP